MMGRLVRKIIKAEKAKGEIEVSLVEDRTIHQLNKQYRKKDKPTDVLAFPYAKAGMMGEVIVSRETVQRNAKKFGVTYRQELKRVVVHGILHVLGYDHGRRMSCAEKTYQKY